MQSLISGEQTNKQEAHLVVSWESLERRNNEYRELVDKKIPANSQEIAIARSYGDLRENHEYKAAKEMQKLLMRRKGELEAQLVRARGTDFANAKTDVVSIGTIVNVTDLDTNKRREIQRPGRVGFRSRKRRHQLSHAGRPVPVEPQSRRRSGIRDGRREEALSHRRHRRLQNRVRFSSPPAREERNALQHRRQGLPPKVT